MKIKTLLLLIFVLLVLVSIALWRERGPSSPAGPKSTADAALLSDLDVNAVESIELIGPAGTTTVVRKEGIWTVAQQYNYPADFRPLAERLRRLADLKMGQLVRGGEQHLDEFGLDAAHAVRVLLKGAGDKTLASIQLGKPRMGGSSESFGGMRMPQGYYVRVGEGPVTLLKEDLSDYPADSGLWTDHVILSVRPETIREISSTSTQGEFHVQVKSPGLYEIAGMKTNEDLNTMNVDRLANALSALRMNRVADPAAQETGYGFDTPAVYTAHAADGMTYIVTLGAVAPPSGRYAKIKIEYAPPAAPTLEQTRASMPLPATQTNEVAAFEKKVQDEWAQRVAAHKQQVASATKKTVDENQRLSRWTYILESSASDSMTLPRTALVQTKQPSSSKP